MNNGCGFFFSFIMMQDQEGEKDYGTEKEEFQ